jgi:IS30 family transposase
MKKKGTKNLTYTQRLQLESCIKAGLHKKIIAEKLNVCLATVYNELKRGAYGHRRKATDIYGDVRYGYDIRYSPNLAEDSYRLNMTSKGAPLKIGNDYDFVHYVEKRILQDKLSPCAVLGEIKRKRLFRTDISKTTIYRYIEAGIFMNITLRDLPMRERKKRYRKTIAKRPPRGTSIEKRPAEVNVRTTFGHWEMDCVCGLTRPALLVLTERLTRNEIIMPMPDQKAKSVIRCLNVLERRYGATFRRVFKSITVDNGSEFADSKGIERSIYRGKRTAVYYCHPYCACERGSNERLNREIRRKLPKGTDFARLSAEDIQAVENWVNAYPREILGFATSAEVFQQELAALS